MQIWSSRNISYHQCRKMEQQLMFCLFFFFFFFRLKLRYEGVKEGPSFCNGHSPAVTITFICPSARQAVRRCLVFHLITAYLLYSVISQFSQWFIREVTLRWSATWTVGMRLSGDWVRLPQRLPGESQLHTDQRTARHLHWPYSPDTHPWVNSISLVRGNDVNIVSVERMKEWWIWYGV